MRAVWTKALSKLLNAINRMSQLDNVGNAVPDASPAIPVAINHMSAMMFIQACCRPNLPQAKLNTIAGTKIVVADM